MAEVLAARTQIYNRTKQEYDETLNFAAEGYKQDIDNGLTRHCFEEWAEKNFPPYSASQQELKRARAEYLQVGLNLNHQEFEKKDRELEEERRKRIAEIDAYLTAKLNKS